MSKFGSSVSGAFKRAASGVSSFSGFSGPGSHTSGSGTQRPGLEAGARASCALHRAHARALCWPEERVCCCCC